MRVACHSQRAQAPRSHAERCGTVHAEKLWRRPAREIVDEVDPAASAAQTVRLAHARGRYRLARPARRPVAPDSLSKAREASWDDQRSRRRWELSADPMSRQRARHAHILAGAPPRDSSELSGP